MRMVSLSILAATTLAAVACQPGDVTNQNGGSNGGANTIMAQVAASDVSRPSGPAGSMATVSGTVTFSGVRVDLWDGQQWLTVADGSGSATIQIGDGTAAATLVPQSAIPAGEYTRARVSATNAAVDITVNGQGFSARVGNPTAGPFVIEKTVSVSVNADGSRTFSIELQLIRSVSLTSGTNGAVIQVDGDLGAMSVPAAAAPGSVLATDISRPTDPAGAPINVTGTVTFTGLSVELWNGTAWLHVANGSGSATVSIGDGSASATLVPATAIAAGDYTKVRISATDAVASLTAVIDGREVAAEVRAPSDRPFVVEKTVTVTVNADGSRTFAVQLDLVHTVRVAPDPVTGAPKLDVTGELVGQP